MYTHDFDRYCQIIHHKCCTNFQSHKYYVRELVYLNLYHPNVLSIFLISASLLD